MTGEDVDESPVGEAVVAGGGLAGLAAAHRLACRGWRVTVLEKEAEAGGRCRTASLDGYLFDTGAQFCRDSYDSTLKTAIELAIGERFRMPGAPCGLLRGGRVLQFVPRSARSVALLPARAFGLTGLLYAARSASPALREYRSYNVRFPGWWANGDGQTAASFLEGRASAEYRSALAEPLALYGLGVGLGRVSVAGLMVAARLALADRAVSFTTGMGSLAEALAGRVNVQAGVEVTGVLLKNGTAAGVAAREKGGERREYVADFVVCALTAPHALEICGTLGTAARSAAERVEYAEAIVVNIALGGRAGGTPGPVLLPRGEGFRASWVSTNEAKAHEQAPGEGSVVTVVFSGDDARLLLEEDDEAVADLALSEAGRVYGRAAVSPEFWRVDRHPLGRPVVSPGRASLVRGLMEEGSGIRRLALAGDWTSSPTVEGAVMSGFDAAQRAPEDARMEA